MARVGAYWKRAAQAFAAGIHRLATPRRRGLPGAAVSRVIWLTVVHGWVCRRAPPVPVRRAPPAHRKLAGLGPVVVWVHQQGQRTQGPMHGSHIGTPAVCLDSARERAMGGSAELPPHTRWNRVHKPAQGEGAVCGRGCRRARQRACSVGTRSQLCGVRVGWLVRGGRRRREELDVLPSSWVTPWSARSGAGAGSGDGGGVQRLAPCGHGRVWQFWKLRAACQLQAHIYRLNTQTGPTPERAMGLPCKARARRRPEETIRCGSDSRFDIAVWPHGGGRAVAADPHTHTVGAMPGHADASRNRGPPTLQ